MGVKFKYILLVFIFFTQLTITQVVKIINVTTNMPIEDVAVFNSSHMVSSLSNKDGEVNVENFKANDSIFFQHPSFETIGMLVSSAIEMKEVFLKRRNILIEEFVVSASKSRERKSTVPFMVDVLDDKKLSISTSQTSAELLENTGNIMVQKSQGGGGSPILRGFEANKLLLVVDGVRLNNAIYRSGHLQNSITIDNDMLERVEVIYGPKSVIYGSDALGGVIHYYTKKAQYAKENFIFKTNAGSSYSTANKGSQNHIDINIGNKNMASMTSLTYSRFGDIKMGSNRNPFIDEYGECYDYVVRIDGRDSTMANDNPLIQKKTGYEQVDVMQKIAVKPTEKTELVGNFQYSTSSDVSRYDKLNDYNGENLKYAEWYYGPQNRLLLSIKGDVLITTRAFTRFTPIIAYQRIDEDRISRRFNIDDQLHQEEDVHVYSVNLDFVKVTEDEKILNYGFEAQYNIVNSNAYYEHIPTGPYFIAQTRYPAGGSNTGSYSAYLSNKWKLDEKRIVSGGLRYNFAHQYSEFNDSNLPYDSIKSSTNAITGSISYIYLPSADWRINFIASTGYRNPNVDDYGKVRAKGGFVTVPNNELKPEHSYNFELGARKIFDGYIRIESSLFYTLINNAIVRNSYMLNGSDSLLYDGEYYKIITNINSNQAYIYGVSVNIFSDLNSNLSFKSTLNYTKGRDITLDVPLAHIPPTFGRTTIQYETKRFVYEGHIIYSDWKRTVDFSPFGEDNETEATDFGFPSWYTLNLRTTFEVNKVIKLQAAVENIFDKYYKVFASGVSAPGRNFIFTARVTI